MLADVNIKLRDLGSGYIAGSGDGIVRVSGVPASRWVYLFMLSDVNPPFELLHGQVSLKNGHYLFNNIDPSRQYLVMCRDLPPNGTEQRYEPAVFDYVTPATDLTLQQQQELWQSWQTT